MKSHLADEFNVDHKNDLLHGRFGILTYANKIIFYLLRSAKRSSVEFLARTKFVATGQLRENILDVSEKIILQR